ncbi:MAG: 6-bladed beta-propeller, partial [Nitrososphaerales archaeon]
MKKRLDIIIVVLIIFGTPFVYAELDFIKTWGSPGTDDGKFSSPTTVAVDSSGYLYVTELNNHRVQKFDSDGRFITKWG